MKKKFKNLKKIAITTGDVNGIGLEVAAKALTQLKPSIKKNKTIFFVFRHVSQEKFQPRYFKLIDSCYLRFTFSSLDNAFLFLDLIDSEKHLPDNLLIDLALNTSEADWVFEAAKACYNKKLTSLVTGPMSKKVSSTLNNQPLGHTGIFRHMFPNNKMHMAFWGKSFNVLLATDHKPLNEVEGSLLSGDFKSSIEAAFEFKKTFKDKRKIAVLGLNPHAGESGLIGKTELKLFKNLNKKNIVGPLVPDAAFLKKNLNKFCLFVCMYHDQGLIPFKAHHGQDSGVHITMGLPFLRTSVDHGTAADLFNKNSANENSMLDAIKLNLKLLGVKNV